MKSLAEANPRKFSYSKYFRYTVDSLLGLEIEQCPLIRKPLINLTWVEGCVHVTILLQTWVELEGCVHVTILLQA